MHRGDAAPKTTCWAKYQARDIVCIVRTVRVLNVFAALTAMVMYPLILLLDFTTYWVPQKLTLIVYMILFSFLLIMVSCDCFRGYFMKYYGFLYTYIGRALWIVFIGSLCCITSHALSVLTAVVVITIAAINMFVMATRKEFRQGGIYALSANPNASDPSRKQLSAAAGSYAVDYAKRNPDQVASVVKAGGDYAKDHPDQARAGFNAAVSSQVS